MTGLMAQLARGIDHLHSAGYLHCDIKPDNVMVTPDERVVVLDFGLVTAASSGSHEKDIRNVCGTPAYMAPEQFSSGPLSAAADWYAVGTVLYRLLTGHLPFRGPPQVMKLAKLHKPPSVSSLRPDVPTSLSRLTDELLDPDPSKRPDYGRIMKVLAPRSTRAHSEPVQLDRAASAIHGRGRHLERLVSAAKSSLHGGSSLIRLHGRSGMGKSMLTTRFLEYASEELDMCVVRGECLEQESVPFKALDALVDSTARRLAQLSEAELRRIVPPDVGALSRVFPVLSSFTEDRHSSLGPDAHARRRAAVGAFRELLANLAMEAPLVVCIDDLQWGDIDSLPFLLGLVEPVPIPNLCLMLSYRTEAKQSSALLARLFENEDLEGAASIIEVGRLAMSEAGRMVQDLMGPAADAVAVEEIVREAGGDPFLLKQLTSYHLRRSGKVWKVEISLTDVVAHTIQQLPPAAKEALFLLALLGPRSSQKLLAHALGNKAEGWQATRTAVLGTGFVSTNGRRQHDVIYLDHDRLRVAISGLIEPARVKELHVQIADALYIVDPENDEALCSHLRAAGDPDKAASHAARAGQEAYAGCAFDRAALLFKQALESRALSANERAALTVRLADSLMNAGRGAESAPWYLTASRLIGGDEGISLRHKASEQLLISGHLDEGMKELSVALSKQGVRLPTTRMGSVAEYIFQRAALRARGLGVDLAKPPDPEKAATAASIRVAVNGFLVADPITSLALHTRALRVALESRDPHQIARGLIHEVGRYSSSGTAADLKRMELSYRTARRLIRKLDAPYLNAFMAAVRGVSSCLIGKWRESVRLCALADRLFARDCRGVTWERDTARLYRMMSEIFRGRWDKMRPQIHPLLRDSADRGDLYFEVCLRTRVVPFVLLAADDPDGAEQQSSDAASRWSKQAFYTPHLWNSTSHVETALYRGDPDRASAILAQDWPRYRAMMIFRVSHARIEFGALRARCALASLQHASEREGRRYRGVVHRTIAALSREHCRWAKPISKLLASGLDSQSVQSRLTQLQEAASEFIALDMAAYANVASARAAELRDDHAGREQAHQSLRELGSKRPDAIVGQLGPGCFG